MDFRDYALHEASALTSRLLARQSEASLQQVRSVREALDAAERAVESAPQVDKEIQELVNRLVNAAGAVVKRVREEAASRLEDARKALDTARDEAAADRNEKEKIAVALNETRAQADDLNAALEGERERIEAARHELSASREEHARLDAARGEAEAALEQEIQARAAVEEELRATRESLDASTASAVTLRNDLTSARQALDAAAAKAEKIGALHAAATAAAEREMEELRGSLEGALADCGRLGEQLEGAAGEKGKLQAELSATHAELHTAREQREAIAAQLKASVARAQKLERSQAQAEDHVRMLESKLKDAEGKLSDAQGKLTGAMQAEKALREQAANREQESAGAEARVVALGAEADRARKLMDTCARGIDELASATTISGLLGAFAKQLSAEFPRVAVFRVKGNRLEGEHQIGFDDKKDVTKLVIPLNMDSFLTRVVASGTGESLTGNALTETGSTPLGGKPTAAIAMPLSLQGETLAVVYADNSGQKTPVTAAGQELATGFATLMLKQAGVLLMRLTHEMKMLTELRGYATMLLQEAEQMHGVDTTAGMPESERRRRLKDTLDCARQLYAQRAAMEGDGATTLLDEMIVAAVKAQGPFAQDLAAIIGYKPGADARRASAS
jgi:predicted  nucleic acid-binding Zn-ribbon protein